MKKIKHTIAFSIVWLIAWCMVGCRYDTDIPNPQHYAKIYMPQAAETSIDYVFTVSDETEEIIFGAAFGGPASLESDVEVQFEVSPHLVDSFNTANSTSYKLLPESSYELENMKTHIQKGAINSDPLTINVFTKNGLVPYEKYVLPISITQVTGDVPLNMGLKTSFFVVEAQREGIRLKIMSLGKGSGYNDMDALASIVNAEKPDLLVLREMDKNTTRSGPTDQPQVISEKIGMPHYVFANALDYQNGEYGSVIYSRFPIVEQATYMLPTSVSEKGPLAIAVLQVDDSHQLVFAGTHLNANESRRSTQTPELLRILGEYTQPVILAGNINDNPNGENINGQSGETYEQLKTQFYVPCTPCLPNFTKSNPTTFSDMILYREADEFRILNYYLGTESTSNHLPVIAELQLFY